MSDIKKAVVVFHYAEKTKSNLILAASLVEILGEMRDEEVGGAEKLLIAYLNALIREVNIAANASGVQGFHAVSAKLEEAVAETRKHNYDNVMKLVSGAISIATTSGNSAAETLKENGLI
ncbi:MAG: hypothetical protein QXF44_03080 [Candidatus Bathyarchaeia archaeon]